MQGGGGGGAVVVDSSSSKDGHAPARAPAPGRSFPVKLVVRPLLLFAVLVTGFLAAALLLFVLGGGGSAVSYYRVPTLAVPDVLLAAPCAEEKKEDEAVDRWWARPPARSAWHNMTDEELLWAASFDPRRRQRRPSAPGKWPSCSSPVDRCRWRRSGSGSSTAPAGGGCSRCTCTPRRGTTSTSRRRRRSTAGRCPARPRSIRRRSITGAPPRVKYVVAVPSVGRSRREEEQDGIGKGSTQDTSPTLGSHRRAVAVNVRSAAVVFSFSDCVEESYSYSCCHCCACSSNHQGNSDEE